MSTDDIEVRIDRDGIHFMRPKLIGEGLATTDEYTWGEVDSVSVRQINQLDRTAESDFPIAVDVTDASLSIVKSTKENEEHWNELEEKGIRYHWEGESVEFSEEKSNNECFRDFIRFMFDQGYISERDLPITMPKAKKNFILNSSRETLKEGVEMEHAELVDVGNGVYYNPKDPTGQKKEHITYLIREFGPEGPE